MNGSANTLLYIDENLGTDVHKIKHEWFLSRHVLSCSHFSPSDFPYTITIRSRCEWNHLKTFKIKTSKSHWFLFIHSSKTVWESMKHGYRCGHQTQHSDLTPIIIWENNIIQYNHVCRCGIPEHGWSQQCVCFIDVNCKKWSKGNIDTKHNTDNNLRQWHNSM
jgi:hypothetical protein